MLAIEGLRARIALPHAEPERGGSAAPGALLRHLHEARRHASSVPGLVHVEAPQLDAALLRHARGALAGPQLCEAGPTAFGTVHDQCLDVRIADLGELLLRTERRGEM